MENIFTPKTEIDCKIRKLQTQLTDQGIDAALILQNTDLFYFAGTIQQSQLYIPAQGQPLLMVKRSLERAIEESPIERIVPINSYGQIPQILSQHGYELPKTIGMELDVLPTNAYLSFCRVFKSAKISDISHYIRLIRAVKSDYEIALIRHAAGLSDQLTSCVKDFLQEGISEVELSSKIEAVARKLGHQGIVRMRLWGAELFLGHLMSGASAAVPSYLSSPTGGMGISPVIAQGASLKQIARHEPILVDYAFACQGYISDETRIFAIGELSDDLMKAYQAMRSVQELVIKTAKPGMTAGDMYDIAFQHVEELGYADNFMGAGQDQVRFIGHGVGLELDEYPFIAKGQTISLQKNMTVAFEPKLVFPGKGVVGIENTFLMNDTGFEQLTNFDEHIIFVLGEYLMESVLFDKENGIGWLTLNRPDTRNALSTEMMSNIQEKLMQIRDDADVRVVVIRANGPVFCAGHNIREMAGEHDIHHFRKIFGLCSEMMQSLHNLPQPVIAQVHGIATAAGCQLVAACDLAIAEQGARFATPGVKIGLFCSTPMVPLSRVIGRRRAMEMLLTGRLVSAQEAYLWGLVNKVVEAEKLAEETRSWAMQLAQHSRFTLGFGKRVFYTQIEQDEAMAYNFAKEQMAINCLTEDAQEGMKAFIEKRTPVWKDR